MDSNESDKLINNVAAQDHMTNDSNYNDGLKLIRKFGYGQVSTREEVKYWRMCNQGIVGCEYDEK